MLETFHQFFKLPTIYLEFIKNSQNSPRVFRKALDTSQERTKLPRDTWHFLENFPAVFRTSESFPELLRSSELPRSVWNILKLLKIASSQNFEKLCNLHKFSKKSLELSWYIQQFSLGSSWKLSGTFAAILEKSLKYMELLRGFVNLLLVLRSLRIFRKILELPRSAQNFSKTLWTSQNIDFPKSFH